MNQQNEVKDNSNNKNNNDNDNTQSTKRASPNKRENWNKIKTKA